MKQNSDVGILVFAYNRPSHLKRLIISLEDYGIKKVNLFLDGPKNLKDKVCQKEIMFMLKTNKLINFNIYKKNKNYGLANSLVRGIDKMSKLHKKIIVLEDDCIPRKEFFEFLFKALNIYEKNDQISAICGYQLPQLHKKKNKNIEAILFNHFIPWGWGVWSKKWREYRNIKTNLTTTTLKKIKASNLKKITKFLNTSKNSWTPKYVINNYILEKKYIFPSKSLIKNIGFDGSGINSKLTNKFNTYYTQSKKILLKKDISLDNKLSIQQEKILSKLIKYYY